MRTRAALAAILVCASAAFAAAREPCSVPEALADPQTLFPQTSFAVKRKQRLDVLVLSGAPSQTGAAKGLRSYPSYFEATLKERLPGVEIRLTVRGTRRRTVMDLQPLLPAMLDAAKPNLVIWQSGTVEAHRGIDPEAFGKSLQAGVIQVVQRETDVILVDMQYSPRTSFLVDSAAYIENMRRVTETFDIAFFNRHDIMRYWNDSGVFDLSSLKDDGLYEKIHRCIGRLLADFVVRGASLAKFKDGGQ